MSSERRGGGGFGGVFVLLIVVGFIVKFWVYIVAVLGALVLFGLLWWLVSSWDRRAEARARAQAAIAARADQQHAWVLAGDDRGIYGDYKPAQID
jgi:hypothetical protein